MEQAVCTVKIRGWKSWLRTQFEVRCNVCRRSLGMFSQHESAMAWADAHAYSSKHIIEE